MAFEKATNLEILDKIKNQDKLISDFDEHMWYAQIEKLTVNRKLILKLN